MQIELILNNGLGESILLPPELALDGYAVKKEIPGTVIPGRAGRRTFRRLQRLEPGVLRASGTIECYSKEEADDFAALLRGKLINDDVMWLKRFEGANKFIQVQCTDIDHDYIRGHFGARAFTMDITFQADDPYWYSMDYHQVKRDVVFTPPVTMLDVNNEGSVNADPMIWLYGKTIGGLHTKNPKLTNYTTGLTLQYAGEIKQGELLLLDTQKRNALFVGNNVLQSGTARSGTSGGIQLATSASAVDDYYKDQIVKVVSGAGAGQYRKIIGYNGATRVAIVDTPWDVIPNATSVYEIYHFSWAEGYYLYEAQSYGGTSGVSVIDNVNAGYLVDGFHLAPGVNRIELEDDNNLLNIEILFKERWS